VRHGRARRWRSANLGHLILWRGLEQGFGFLLDFSLCFNLSGFLGNPPQTGEPNLQNAHRAKSGNLFLGGNSTDLHGTNPYQSQVLWLTHHFFTCFVCKTAYHWYFWLFFVAKVTRFISRSPGGRHSADSSAGGRLAFQGLHRGCGARRTWGFQGLSRSDSVKACELQMSHPGCDWDELVEVWFDILYPRVNKCK